MLISGTKPEAGYRISLLILLALIVNNGSDSSAYANTRDAQQESASKETQATDDGEPNNERATKRKYTKPSDAVLKKRLTRMQYKVTQSNGTERAFKNAYWNNKRPGIYVDIVSGEPLFSSNDKFESGTGWPSFTQPLVPEHIVEKLDRGFFGNRTEVRSKHGDSHLGHVFGGGPAPTGLRYCINSAALRFIPVSKLEDEGYGEFVKTFRSAEDPKKD